MDAALNIITYKDRTVAELKKKLTEKGYGLSEIEDVIARLSEYSYVDDQRYAIHFAKGRSESRGARVIRMELKNKGVSDSLIALAMEELDVDESETVEKLLRRRYGNEDLRDEKTRNRAYGFLMRRGFSYDTISRAISSIYTESESS